MIGLKWNGLIHPTEYLDQSSLNYPLFTACSCSSIILGSLFFSFSRSYSSCNTLIRSVFKELLLKCSGEPWLLRFWGKYQVQLQKVTDIRWVSLREPGPYYRHWPVKYHIAHEHAQQNDAIWEDVTLQPQVTPSWHSGRGGVCSQGLIMQTHLSLPLHLSDGLL